jgi:hypothetical protein
MKAVAAADVDSEFGSEQRPRVDRCRGHMLVYDLLRLFEVGDCFNPSSFPEPAMGRARTTPFGLDASPDLLTCSRVKW